MHRGQLFLQFVPLGGQRLRLLALLQHCLHLRRRLRWRRLRRGADRWRGRCRDSTLGARGLRWRSEEHTSELQSLMRISYAVFCLKKKKHRHKALRNRIKGETDKTSDDLMS